MLQTLMIGRALLGAACAMWLVAASVGEAHANWLTRLSHIGGDVAGTGAKAVRGELSGAAGFVRSLPADGKSAALAAHATPEGHWKFANREGDVFTAGSPDELVRAVPTLLLGVAADAKLNIYLSEQTVFGDRKLLADLPSAASLHLVVGRESYPLVTRTAGGAPTLHATVRPAVLVDLTGPALLHEAVALLERPLSRSGIRVLALEPGTSATLSSRPRFDAQGRLALIDAVDPATLPASLAALRGQTVLLTGRVDEGMLRFRPAAGGEQALKLTDVTRAAADADVNVVVLHADNPRQPGGRNWLWQPIAVGGLDAALKRATFADFLEAFSGSLGEIGVDVRHGTSGRVVLRAAPRNAGSDALTGIVGDWWSSAVSSITGNVVTGALEVHARDADRQRELDNRLIKSLPSWLQFAYLGAVVAGLLGWPVAIRWFAALWPPEARAEYRSAVGYRLAQCVRLIAYLIVFLPLAGLPALIVNSLQQLWSFVMLPVRAVRWIAARPAAPAG